MNDVVVVKSGEILRFPVLSDHPLVKYQQQVDVSQASNLREIAVISAKLQTIPSMTSTHITSVVKGILADLNTSTIFQLTLPDVMVEEGATLVLDGPITTMTAGNVIVLGDILVLGSLNLSCATLGGVAPPVISSIGPSSGSTRGGARVHIQGTGLSNVTAVYFGSVPATAFNIDSDGALGAAAPPASLGSVNITVVSYGVLSSTPSAADVFTYAYIPGVASFAVAQNFLFAGESTTGTITLNQPAAPGGTTVSLGLSGDQGLNVPPTVTIGAGALSATFPIAASLVATAGSVQIIANAQDGSYASVAVNFYPGQIYVDLNLEQQTSDSGYTFDYLLSGHRVTATMFVRTPAPVSGATVALTTNHLNAISMPASVLLAGGSTSTTFTLTGLEVTFPVLGVTVSANYGGIIFTSDAFLVSRIPPHVPNPPPGGPFPS